MIERHRRHIQFSIYHPLMELLTIGHTQLNQLPEKRLQKSGRIHLQYLDVLSDNLI